MFGHSSRTCSWPCAPFRCFSSLIPCFFASIPRCSKIALLQDDFSIICFSHRRCVSLTLLVIERLLSFPGNSQVNFQVFDPKNYLDLNFRAKINLYIFCDNLNHQEFDFSCQNWFELTTFHIWIFAPKLSKSYCQNVEFSWDELKKRFFQDFEFSRQK